MEGCERPARQLPNFEPRSCPNAAHNFDQTWTIVSAVLELSEVPRGVKVVRRVRAPRSYPNPSKSAPLFDLPLYLYSEP